MIIDNIIKWKESSRVRNNSLIGKETLDNLSTYIFRGEYTRVKNKEFILKYWLILSPKQMAEKLNISVKGVYYLKKKINEHLVTELGTDIVRLIANDNFNEINNRIKLSRRRLNTDSAFPKYINSLINKNMMKSNLVVSDENKMKALLKTVLDGTNTSNVFLPELEFIKVHRKVQINKEIRKLNPMLLYYLMQIVTNQKSNLELRNLLFKYLNDSQ